MMTRFRKGGYAVPLFLAFMLLLCALVWCLRGGKDRGWVTTVHTSAEQENGLPLCVVIDAGHGGEDGGASSEAGLMEKEVNLAVAMALRDLCEAAGIPTVMTRTEDILLYDRNVDFAGRKKVLDLAARRMVAEDVAEKYDGNSLFISIHMNAFPVPRYDGMQVWYSVGDPRSAEVAAAIQTASAALMPDNHRKIKAAGSRIYLLDRIKSPAVLVECGFMSNPTEAERLSREDYRHALAAVIFAGMVAGQGDGS